MKLVVDMNLSPAWCAVLATHGWTALHWSEVGDARAPDKEIMAWALAHDHVVLTHDLDLGAILAATGAEGPSVVQVRTQDTMPPHLEPILVRALTDFEAALKTGALLVVEEARSRIRVLPLPR